MANAQPQAETFLTVKEVASRLRLSKRTVHYFISRGHLPYVDLSSGSKRAPRIRSRSHAGGGSLSNNTGNRHKD